MDRFERILRVLIIAIFFLCFGVSSVFSQNTSVRTDKETTVSLLKENWEIYHLNINLNTHKATSTKVSPPSLKSLETLSPVDKSESFKINKKGVISFSGAEVKIFNDISELNLNSLSEKWYKPSLLKKNSHWLYRLVELKGKPVFLVGNTLYIGTKEDIKGGNYKIIGINQYENNNVLFYLAHYKKNRLNRLDLSNRHIFHDIKKEGRRAFNVTRWNDKGNKTTVLVYRKGILNGWKLDLKDMGTYLLFDGGILSPDNFNRLRNGSGKNYIFKSSPIPGFMLINKISRDVELYNKMGYRLIESNYLGTKKGKGSKPLKLNIAKYNDPRGEVLTIGGERAAIWIQKMTDVSQFQDMTLNIAKYNDPEGVALKYSYPYLRQATVVKLDTNGVASRVISRSNEFGEFLPEVPLFDSSCLNTDFHKAVLSKDFKKIDSLLKKDRRYVHIKNIDGNTPLHLAAFKGNIDVAKKLIEFGSKIYSRNEIGNTPLHFAASAPSEKMLNFLLTNGKKEENEYGVGINITNTIGMTPIHYAALNEQGLNVKLLLSKNAIPDSRDFSGYTPLDYTNNKMVYGLKRSRKEHLYPIAELLLNKMVLFKKLKIVGRAIGENNSINAEAFKLRFYESDYYFTPYEKRVYRRSFASSETRYIAWELHLKYPKTKRKIDFTIRHIWKGKNNKVINQFDKTTSIEKGWANSWVTGSYGRKTPGSRSPGIYLVELHIEKTKIAKGSFMVY